MAEAITAPIETNLMREMGIDERAVERRLKVVGLTPEDLTQIASIRQIVTQQAEHLSGMFFSYLASLDEARSLLANRELLERARKLETEHVVAMVQGNYGLDYVVQRLKLGLLCSRADLEVRVFLGAFHHVLRAVGGLLIKTFDGSPFDGFDRFMSLKKVAFFDVGLIIDVLVFERERTIRQQQEAIRELSTPVLQVRDRMLLLPIIGVIDTHRARMITENLLRAIRANRARVVVMDVTGVATIDSKVANHLLQTVTAARLMGAMVIVSGLSSEVAQSLVALGIDVSKLNTVGDLQGGVEDAERLLGYRMTQGAETAPALA